MVSTKVYTCFIDEQVEEVELDEKGNPINMSFSVYETDEGKEIAICSQCKKIIECVCSEMLRNKKLKK
jgi:hypothetical protein